MAAIFFSKSHFLNVITFLNINIYSVTKIFVTKKEAVKY